MLLPAVRHELVEVRTRMQAGMHVAVDYAQAALRSHFLFKDGAVDDIAHAILLRISESLCGELQPRKSLKRIIRAHARNQSGRQMRRYRVVAVELPMRIIGREQEHLVRADHVDDVGDAGRIGWSVERLRGDANMVAHDRGRLAGDPWHLEAE